MKPSYVYCPQCGAPLTDQVKFGRVRRACRYCGFIHFAEPKVAVAALVTDGPRVLLVRRLAVPRIGFWALPAGYMDADELPENALVREIAEETGITVRAVALLGVAPLAGWAERRAPRSLPRPPNHTPCQAADAGAALHAGAGFPRRRAPGRRNPAPA